MPQREPITQRFARKVALTHADIRWFSIAAAGLALALMANGIYDGVIIGLAPVPTFASLIDERPFTGGLGYMLGCALLALTLIRSHRQPRYSLAVSAVLASVLGVGIASMAFAASIGAESSSPALVAGMLVSTAAVILLAFWLQAIARAGRPRAFAILGAALLADTLLDLLVHNALVASAGVVATVLGSVASPLLLTALERMDCPCSAESAGTGATHAATARSSYDTPFWVSVAFIAVAALVMGNVQSLGGPAQLEGFLDWVYQHAVNVGAVAASLLALAMVAMRSSHANMRAVILVTLMLALYFAIAFGSTVEPLGRLTMTAARMSIVLYIFLLACDIPWRNGWPMFAFVVGWGVFTLANTTSTRLGLLARDGAGWETAHNVFAICALATLTLIELHVRRTYTDTTVDIPGADDVVPAAPGPAVPIVGEDTPGANAVPGDCATAAGPPAEATGIPEDPLTPNCRAIASKYGLTARELEVLVPLVHGRSAATIAGILGMSVETARTHIRHIYAKTDIHCREDLMDEVEGIAG